MSFFSVVVPVYNREHSILRALFSIHKQSFKDYECFVIDDGSSDGTSRVVQHFCRNHPQFRYLKTENRGVSAARNLGVKLGQSPWICFLDSDDEWLEDKLLKQYEYIKSHPESVLVHSDEIWVRNGKRVNQMKKHTKSGGDIFAACTELCLISPSAVTIKRECFERFGGFDESYEVCEDYDLWLKITSKYSVDYINEALIIKYGGHFDQLSQKYHAMDEWRVRSMMNLLERLRLNETQKQNLLTTLKKKLDILCQGHLKHSRVQRYQLYRAFYDFYFGSQIKKGKLTVKMTELLSKLTESEEFPPLTVS